MLKAYILPIILLLNVLTFSAFAVEVTQLYTGKVEVSSQSKAERANSLKLALAQVMLKVGGNSNFQNDPQIASALKQPQKYVSQFYYERVAEKILLVAEFDQDKVNQLFYQSGLPILGSIRPLLVLWVVEESQLSRKIINHSNEHVLAQTIKTFSTNRAVPMVLPLMDLDDIAQVQVSDIWGRFEAPVKLASQRYLAEASVIIRLSDNTLVEPDLLEQSTCVAPCQANTLYALDWSIIENYQQFGERIQGEDPEQLINQALNAISEHVNQQYALSTHSQNQFTLEVANVDSLTAYVQISRFLADFSAVSGVKLSYAYGQTRRFDLTLVGSKQAFMASLKLTKELEQMIDPLADVDEQAIPVFYWQK